MTYVRVDLCSDYANCRGERYERLSAYLNYRVSYFPPYLKRMYNKRCVFNLYRFHDRIDSLHRFQLPSYYWLLNKDSSSSSWTCVGLRLDSLVIFDVATSVLINLAVVICSITDIKLRNDLKAATNLPILLL